MKFFEPNEKRTTVAVYVFLVALFGVLCVILGINIGVVPKLFSFIFGIVKPILYGFIIAFALHPMVNFAETRIFAKWKEKRLGLRRFISVVLVFVVVILLIMLLGFTLVPEIASNYDKLVVQFMDFADNFRTKTTELVGMMPGSGSLYVHYDVPEYNKHLVSDNMFIVSLGNSAGLNVSASSTSIQQDVREFFNGIVNSISVFIGDSIPRIFSSAVTFINEAKNVIIGVILSLYFLIGERKYVPKIAGTLRAWLPNNVYRRLMWLLAKGKNIFRDYIVVRILDCFLVGMMTFFGLFIFRTPYALFLSVIMGASSIFPFIGPIIGILIGSLVVIIVDIKYLIVYLAVTIVINIIDSRYIEPFLNYSGHNHHELAAIWVFAAIVIMGGFFGPIGVLIGIPFFAFIYSIVKEMSEKRLKHKGLPESTASYFIMRAKKKPVTAGATSTDDEHVPDMETYFAEKKDEDTETYLTMKASMSDKYTTLKKFFGKVFKKKKK